MSLAIDKLKERNQQELLKLDKPYQLAVYAVPQEQWESMTSLLGSNLPLLTEISSEIRQNASERNVNEKTKAIQSSLTELSKQAGKNHDKHSQNLREQERAMLELADNLYKRLRLWVFTGFISLAILLGLLVILSR